MNGNIDKNGTLSYASQEPWVYSGTVRENITFGLPYNQNWYDKVIEACALSKASILLTKSEYKSL